MTILGIHFKAGCVQNPKLHAADVKLVVVEYPRDTDT